MDHPPLSGQTHGRKDSAIQIVTKFTYSYAVADDLYMECRGETIQPEADTL